MSTAHDPLANLLRRAAHLRESDRKLQIDNLTMLPDDVAEAYEQFKLAIKRHRAQQWTEFGDVRMILTLRNLMELVTEKDES